jgi:hypothetical protein
MYLPMRAIHSALSFIGGVHIGARALHVLNLIWFGLAIIARVCSSGEREVISSFRLFLFLPAVATVLVEEGGGVGTLWPYTTCSM